MGDEEARGHPERIFRLSFLRVDRSLEEELVIHVSLIK